jgi:hypothetical protein
MNMRAISKRGGGVSTNGAPLLCNGDRMNQAEFHRRYELYPGNEKFELIGGIVYMTSPLGAVATNGVPMLCNGDHMTQAEFHRRYEMYPGDEKFELIGGIVYMASPLRWRHAEQHADFSVPLGIYRIATPGVQVLDNATTILGEKSEPQPDLSLRIFPEYGGRSRYTDDEYIEGAPEWLGEIAYSSGAIDLHQKKEDYEQAGVLEYLVLCVEEQELHWFHFKSRRRILPDKHGVYRSRVFPGLWIDGPALVSGRSARVLRVLRKGIASPEHAAFVKRLRAAHGK